MPETPISTIGTVRDAMPGGTFHVDLPNGKVVVGHLPRSLADLGADLAPDTRVHLELTPYDFEKARITGVATDA